MPQKFHSSNSSYLRTKSRLSIILKCFVRNFDHVYIWIPDALGSGTVVAGRYEAASTSPAARVDHVERERVGQLGRHVLFQERRDESFRLAPRDHSTASRRDRHRAVTT